MPFIDHVFLKSDPAITAVQDASDPFNGDGALRTDNVGLTVLNPRNVVMERLGPAFFVGEERGLIRTRINISDHPLSITNEAEFGIYFMASQLDLTGVTGAAYAFVLHVGTSFDWRLTEYSLGISLSGQTNHETGSTVGSPALGKSMVMQVDWRLDIPNFGGIRIHCKAADGVDFANLETVYNVTLSSPLSSTVAEGLFYADLEGQTGAGAFTRSWFQNTFYSNFSASALA